MSMTQPRVQWTTPAPLWPAPAGGAEATNGQPAFHRPAILRFATDDFMDEFMKVVANTPARLGEWQARPETWRGPATTPLPIESLPTFAQRLHRLRLGLAAVANGTTPPPLAGAVIPAGKLKLYQPAHQRYYLITACLVCRVPGLPDRLLNNNLGERTTFVIRRLLSGQSGLEPTPDNLDQFEEYAFVSTAQGPRWQRLGEVDTPVTQTLAQGEEQLPLFGVTYAEDERGKRRLLAGVIPAGKREAYTGTAAPAPGDTTTINLPDPRETVLLTDATQPWRSLVDTKQVALARLAESAAAGQPPAQIAQETQALADQLQTASWYILLDLADYLAKYLPDVWNELPAGSGAGLSTAGQNLLQAIKTAAVGSGRTLAQALAEIGDFREMLEGTAVTFETGDSGWPPLFSLVDDALLADLDADDLEALVAAALAGTPAPADTPPIMAAVRQSAVDMSNPPWFIIRCVFERPNCIDFDQPPILTSRATEPFQIASFFDPDAPARPIRISMPLDTSPAGLRKFNKNTAFVISDVLACQMERAGNLTLGDLVLSVLPWPFHKSLPAPEAGPCAEDGLSLGMICTLSIPIITICALILLMIIVSLLDIIFHWLPYFILCFPLPSLKGKESS